MSTKLGKFGKAVLVGGSAIAMAASATPAHAALYATGTFAYSQVASQCFEVFVSTGAGTTGCSVGLTIETFSLVVNHRDGTCSGVADATMTIISPSTPTAPPAQGTIVVSHGVGKFNGTGTDGLIISIGHATLTGSRCRPENVLGSTESLSGKYELHA